jgi:hypothetical protein
VPDGLQQLIDDGNLRRIQRRHPGPIQNKPPTGAGEQAENDRMFTENILLKNPGGVAVQLEHHGVERQHILGRDISRARARTSFDGLHIGRQALGPHCLAQIYQKRRHRGRIEAASQKGTSSHDSLAGESVHQFGDTLLRKHARTRLPGSRLCVRTRQLVAGRLTENVKPNQSISFAESNRLMHSKPFKCKIALGVSGKLGASSIIFDISGESIALGSASEHGQQGRRSSTRCCGSNRVCSQQR